MNTFEISTFSAANELKYFSAFDWTISSFSGAHIVANSLAKS